MLFAIVDVEPDQIRDIELIVFQVGQRGPFDPQFLTGQTLGLLPRSNVCHSQSVTIRDGLNREDIV